MKQITVIIPLHKYDEEVQAALPTAVKSLVETSKNNPAVLMFVGPKEVLEQIKGDAVSKPGLETIFVENENSWFSAQINAAAKKVKTEYFSILEFDDEYSPIWFDNVAKYVDNDDSVSVYLPLTEVFDYKQKEQGPIGYTNEAVWASSFSERLGYFDHDCLQDYLIFNTTGGVFKTKDFIEIGGLKESMKLSFWYEFLMRAINKDKDVFVIPKVGYFHAVNRDGSLVDEYSKTMSDRESDFWIELARKEYLYKTDRKKTYEE